MRWLAAACLVLAVGSAHGEPASDETASGDLVPTRLTAKLVGTTATISATFRLDVTGPTSELGNQGSFQLPDASVVTGAIVRGPDHVERLALERVATVNAKFAALRARPSRDNRRTWGVRLDVANGQATVGVAAPRDATLTLEVTFEAATCFLDDVRYVAIATSWVPAIPRPLVQATPRDDLADTCGASDESGWIALPSRDLAARPAGNERVGVRASKLSLPTLEIARVEIALAAELTEIPRDLHTAIIVDHSRSLTPAERENQRATVEAYLRAAPNSRVQVIGYARTAAPLLAGWTVASQATGRVDRAIRALPPRNGSNLDEALAAANTWLANVQGTRRVIVFTDERLVERITADPVALQALLPDQTLVHVVDVTGAGALLRSDDALFAPLAKATGGIAVSGAPDANGAVDASLLARPLSLDNVSIKGDGWKENTRDSRSCDLTFPLVITEGHSCVWWADGTSTTGDITVTGALWGTTVTKTVRPDARGARSLARILSTHTNLDVDMLQAVESAAVAVNSAWSLFAMWGPRGGYDEPDGFGSFGTIGMGSIGSSSHDVGIGLGTVARLPDRELRQQLAAAVGRCHPRGVVTVTVETTFQEIVGVVVQAADRDPAIEVCITEGVWDTSVLLVEAPRHMSTKLVFQPS
jgi:hypothetical protein